MWRVMQQNWLKKKTHKRLTDHQPYLPKDTPAYVEMRGRVEKRTLFADLFNFNVQKNL